jgi:hypothetical protein
MKTDFCIMEEDVVKAHITIDGQTVLSEVYPDPESCSKIEGKLTLEHIEKFLFSRFCVSYANAGNKTANAIRFAGFTDDTEPFIMDNLYKNNGVSTEDTTWVRFGDQKDLKWEDVMFN